MSDINWLAALAAAIVGYLLGLLWYSPIGFLHLWIRAAQIQRPPTPTPQMFVLLFVLQLVAASGFALLLGPNPELSDAMRQALIVGVCLVAASFAVNDTFENRPWRHWLIDSSYHVVRFLLFGLILGNWH
jgi:dipeptide/tripeptide permease